MTEEGQIGMLDPPQRRKWIQFDDHWDEEALQLKGGRSLTDPPSISESSSSISSSSASVTFSSNSDLYSSSSSVDSRRKSLMETRNSSIPVEFNASFGGITDKTAGSWRHPSAANPVPSFYFDESETASSPSLSSSVDENILRYAALEEMKDLSLGWSKNLLTESKVGNQMCIVGKLDRNDFPAKLD